MNVEYSVLSFHDISFIINSLFIVVAIGFFTVFIKLSGIPDIPGKRFLQIGLLVGLLLIVAHCAIAFHMGPSVSWTAEEGKPLEIYIIEIINVLSAFNYVITAYGALRMTIHLSRLKHLQKSH